VIYTQVELVDIAKLHGYEKNARKHDKKSVEAIAKSIEAFGFNDPVGIWGDNIIVEGHGRVQAAKKLGIKEIPCIRLDHLTDEQRRAYGLAHNKTAEVSDWDYDLLDFEINDLPDFDFEDFGFEIRDAELEHERNYIDPLLCSCYRSVLLCRNRSAEEGTEEKGRADEQAGSRRLRCHDQRYVWTGHRHYQRHGHRRVRRKELPYPDAEGGDRKR